MGRFVDVTLNMACSLDGRVAAADGSRLQLSSREDAARTHRLRAEADAVLVGVGTVLADDPELTARTDPPPQRQPLRVVLDSHLRTPPTARVVNGGPATLILTAQRAKDRCGDAKVVVAGEGEVDLDRALKVLSTEGVERLLIEGGPTVASAFLTARLVGTFHLYVAPRIRGVGPSLWASLAHTELELRLAAVDRLGEGVLLTFEGPA